MIITLISFLTSLCLQFCSVGVTPYNMLPNNQSGIGDAQIDIVLDRIRNNYQGYWGDSYRWVLDVPRESIIVIKGFTLWGAYNNEYTVLVPKEYNDPNVSSVLQCNSYTVGSDDVVNSVSLNFNQYIQFCTTYSYVNNPYVAGFQSFQFDNSNNWELVYCEVPIYCNGDLVVNVTDDVTVPSLGLGSLGHSGYGSDGDPLESLSAFSGWSVTGHSTHSVTVTDPISSVDSSSPTNNLLAQILNNIKAVYNYLGNINNNIINGISALFNAVSAGFNSIYNEIVSEYTIDFDSVSAAWHDTTLFTLVSFVDSTPTTISNTSSDIIISWDFSNLVFGVPNNNINVSAIRSISGSYNLSQALNPSKSVWQPLLLTFLYGFTFWNFIRSIPNIINGVSSVSNSKEVKEKLK